MINWTQQGAGLRNAGITPNQLQSYYGNALTNFRAAQQPAPTLGGDVLTQRAQANNLTRLSNPFDLGSRVVANPMTGRQAPVAQQIANHRNAVTASQPIVTLSGWMERQGLGSSSALANDMAKNGLAAYQQHLAPARDWELRENVRGDIRGGSGIVGLGLKAAPYIMSYAAGGFGNPLASIGSGIGKSSAGSLANSAMAKAIANYTTPSGLARQAQSAIMGRMRRG